MSLDRREFLQLLGFASVSTVAFPSIALPSIQAPIIHAVPSIIKPATILSDLFAEQKLFAALSNAYAHVECNDISVDKVFVSKNTFNTVKAIGQTYIDEVSYTHMGDVVGDFYLWGAYFSKNYNLKDGDLFLEGKVSDTQYSFAVRLQEDDASLLSNSSYSIDDKIVKKIIERPIDHIWNELDIKDIERDCRKFGFKPKRFLQDDLDCIEIEHKE